MSDPWNWCNPPSVPSLGEGCPPCSGTDVLLTAKYQRDNASGWGSGPSRCLYRLISALWQRYHVLGQAKPDFIENGISFKAGSELFLKTVALRNGYGEQLAQVHQRILEVGLSFANLDGTQVTRQDMLGWGVKESPPSYPDDCTGALRALWNLRYRKATALQVSGVFKYCPFDRKGMVSLQWKVPSYINCRRLVNPRLVSASATQGTITLSGDDNSFIQVLYRLDRPANAFVRQINGITRVTQTTGRYLRAYAPNHFDERLYVERSELSFATDESGSLEQQLLTARHYIGPQAAVTGWNESHSSDEISSEDLVLAGTDPALGVHIYPGLNVLMAPVDQAYSGFAWRLEGNVIKRLGEPADVTRNVKEVPWNRLLFMTDNSGNMDFSDFTKPEYNGKPWNDLDLMEAVFSSSNEPFMTIGGLTYTNRGSVPWMVPGVDQVDFVVEGVTVEIPFDQDDAIGDVPAFETGFWAQPRLVIIQRSPTVRGSLRACFTAPVYEGDSPDPLSWTARVICKDSPFNQQVQQVGGGVLVSDLTCFSFALPGFLSDGSLRAGTLKLEVLFSNGRSLSDFVQVCSLIPGGAFDLPSSSSSHSSESSQPIPPCQEEFVRRMVGYEFLNSDAIGPFADVPPPVRVVNGSIHGEDGGALEAYGLVNCPSFIFKPQRSNWDSRWQLAIFHSFIFLRPDFDARTLPIVGEVNEPGPDPGNPSLGFSSVHWDIEFSNETGTYGFIDWEKRRGFPYPGGRVFFQDWEGASNLYTNWRLGRTPVVYHTTYWPLNLVTEAQIAPLAFYDAMCVDLEITDAVPAMPVYNTDPLLVGELYAAWRTYNANPGPYTVYSPVIVDGHTRSRYDGLTQAGRAARNFIRDVLGFDMGNLDFGDGFPNGVLGNWFASAVIMCSGRTHPRLVQVLGNEEFSSDERESSGGPDERSSSSSSSQSNASSSSSSQSVECTNQPLAPNLSIFNWMLYEITDPVRASWDPRWSLHVVHRLTLSSTDPTFNPIEWGERIVDEKPNMHYQYDGPGNGLYLAWYASFPLEAGTVQTAALSASRSLFDPQAPPVPQGSPGPNGLYESYIIQDASEADFKSFFLGLGVDIDNIDLSGGVASLMWEAYSEVTLACPGWSPSLPSGSVALQTSSSSSLSVPETSSYSSESSASSGSSLSEASSSSSSSSQSELSSSSSSSKSSPTSDSSISELSSASSSSSSSSSSHSSLSEISSASSLSSLSSLSEASSSSSSSNSSSSSSNSSSSSSTVCANQTLAAVSSPNGHAFRHDITNPALVDWHPSWKLSPVFLFKFSGSFTNASSVVTSYNWASRIPGSPPTGWSFVVVEGELFATWSRLLTPDFSQTYQTAALATVDAMFAALISGSSGSDGNGGFTKYQWAASSTGASRLDFVTNTMGLSMSGLSGSAPGTWFNDYNFPVTLWTSTNRFTC